MTVLQINDTEPRRQYTASPSQTVFTYPFEIFEDSDIALYIDGVKKTLTTDYTVTGAGQEFGGTVVLVTPATGGEIVTIYRDLPYSRDNLYTTSGPFKAANVERDFDKLVAMAGQLDRDIGYCIRQALEDTASSSQLLLPVAATRANQVLAFGSQGEIDLQPLAYNLSSTYNSVANLTALRAVLAPNDGDAVVVTDPNEAGLFVFDSSDTQTDNDGTIIEPSDATAGSWLRRAVGYISVKWFGATGDGVTDDTTAVQAAIDAAISTGAELIVPPGDYLIQSTLLADHTKISNKYGINIRGLGSYRNCRFVYSGTASDVCLDVQGTGAVGADNVGRFKIQNITIDGEGNSTAVGALRAGHGFMIEIANCEFGDFDSASAIVVDIVECFNVTLQGVHIFCADAKADLGTAKGTCLRLGALAGTWSTSNVAIRDCLIQFGDIGVDVRSTTSGSNIDSLVFDNTAIDSCREYLFYSPTSTGDKNTLRFTNCHLETVGLTSATTMATGKVGLFIEDWGSVQIDSCHFNANDTHIQIRDCNSTFITNLKVIEGSAFQATLTSTTVIDVDNSGVTGNKVIIGPCSILTAHVETFYTGTGVTYYQNYNPEFSTSYDGNVFTPSLLSGGGTITTDVANGWYQVVGGMCYFTCRLEVASVASPTGILYIDGLPFTCEETISWAVSIGEADLFDLNAADLAVIGYVNKNSNDVILEGLRDNAAAANLAATVQAGTDFTVSGMYRIKPLVSN